MPKNKQPTQPINNTVIKLKKILGAEHLESCFKQCVNPESSNQLISDEETKK